MKVVVTGANGFIGTALCPYLVANGYEVVPVVRRSCEIKGARVLDPDNEGAWDSALVGCESIVHLAGRAHVMQGSPEDFLDTYREANVQASLSLARRAVQAGVRRLVFLSTTKINGEQTTSGSRFRPEDIPAPQDSYSMSKLEAERGLREISARTGIELVVIRPPLVYGPGVKGNFASMVRWVCKQIPLPLGAVRNQRSLVALDNLIDFVALCADRQRSPGAANETFLISDGEDVSTTELLRKVACAYGVPSRLLTIPEVWVQFAANLLGKGAAADRLLGSLVVDSSKAHVLLGWSPVVSMDEQLKKMAEHDALL